MKVEHIESFAVAIPFRLAFRHSLAVRTRSDSLVIRVRDCDGNVGYGESAPREYVTGETVETAAIVAREQFFPEFAHREFEDLDAVANALTTTGSQLSAHEQAAFCAIELALLDVAGKAFGRSAGDVLGAVVDPRPEYSGVVSADGPAEVERTCEALLGLGLRSVKVKLGRPGTTDSEILRVARGVLGPDCSLRGDANGAWTAQTALARIEEFSPYRLDGLEQPVPAQDIDGLAWLTARSSLPIIADESLATLADARLLARRRACHVFNLRVSKCGGLLNTARIRDIAVDAGIGCMLGAHVGETAILSAAGRQIATRIDGLLFREGSFGTLLLEQDIAREDVTFERGGHAPALNGPGLGIDVEFERLRAFATPCDDGAVVRAGHQEDRP